MTYKKVSRVTLSARVKPQVRDAVHKLAQREDRNTSQMLSILLREAIQKRGFYDLG